MPSLRRRALAIAVSFGVLAVASAGSGNAASGREAKVVVVTSGVVPGGEASGYAEYALVLRNRSPTRDAIDVSVEVEGVDARGESFTDNYTTITVIPAASNFVLSGPLIWRGSTQLAGIETDVRVGQLAPRGRQLPPVRHVSARNDGHIVGSITNRYKKPLPESAAIYGVVLDSGGRIVAAGVDLADTLVRPRASASFDIFGNLPRGARLAAVTTTKVSVDPCGYLAFTRACPVAGAQR